MDLEALARKARCFEFNGEKLVPSSKPEDIAFSLFLDFAYKRDFETYHKVFSLELYMKEWSELPIEQREAFLKE